MRVNQENSESALNVLLATLVGIGVQIAVVTPFLMVVYAMAHASPDHPLVYPSTSNWVILIAVYVASPIIYCAIVSASLKPKRIVHPVTIQLFTVAYGGVMVLAILTMSTFSMLSFTATSFFAFIGVSAAVWWLGFLVSYAVGFWQTIAVRWLVGLNEGNPNDVTYTVDIPFELVRSCVTEKEFCDFWDLKLQDHKPEAVLKARFSTGGSLKNDVILVIAPLGQNRTLIHGSAFAEQLYRVAESEEISSRRDHIINDLVGSLPSNANKQRTRNDAALMAISHTFVDACTRSKGSVARARITSWMGILKAIPRPILYTIFITIAAWLIADALFAFLMLNKITFDPSIAIEVNAAFLIATVIELIIPAWSEFRSSRPRLRRPLP
jgi:hypothetical protein